ncbi:MAG: hypothetical protein GX088_00985 [Clostridia bacterium]|nr:hypothetical protein [Clostridia bacterium]
MTENIDLVGIYLEEALKYLKATGLKYKLKVTSEGSREHPYGKMRIVRQKKLPNEIIELVLVSEFTFIYGKGGGNGGL